MQELQIGRVYRHFKGDYYLVEGLAHDSESGVPCVIYRKLYGDGGLWVRPLEMFLSRVDREKYPEVRPGIPLPAAGDRQCGASRGVRLSHGV